MSCRRRRLKPLLQHGIIPASYSRTSSVACSTPETSTETGTNSWNALGYRESRSTASGTCTPPSWSEPGTVPSLSPTALGLGPRPPSQPVRAGHDPVTVAVRIGHRDPSFTLKRYSHAFEDQRKKAGLGLSTLMEPESD